MIAAAVIVALVQAVGAVPAPDEASLRTAVERFYDAQAAKDLRATAGSWSASAVDRPTDGTYQAIFDTGDDRFTVEIKDLSIVGSGARVRVLVNRVRTAHEQDGDHVYRGSAVNSQEWRFEGGAWKLMRDRAVVEDFADVLFASPPDQWSALLARDAADVNQALRYAVAARASSQAARQQFQGALTGFELTLAIDRFLQNRRGEIESLQNIGNAYYFLRDYPNAAGFYGQALAIARETDDQEQVASSQMGLGTAAYSSGDYGAALAAYEAAKHIYEARDEAPSVGRALVSIGNVQFLAGEYDVAAGSYRQALDLLVAGMDFPGAWAARGGLGRVFATQGDLVSALQTYNEMLEDRRARPTPGQRATALESVGEIHYRLGSADEARVRFTEAIRLYEMLPLPATEDAGRAYARLGLTELSAGRADAALAAYTSSRDRYDKAGRLDGVAHGWVGIGFSHASARRFDEAIAAYRTAIAMLDEQHLAEDSARAWLGLSLAQSGKADHEAALESARRVETAANALNNDELRWRAGVREGAALRALGRLDESLVSLEAAAATVERMTPDAATSGEARAALDGSASAWAELAFTFAAKQQPASALLAIERRHAHARRMMLAPFERDITAGMTPEEQRDEHQNTRDIVSTRAQLRAERGAPRPDPRRIAQLQDRLSGLSVGRAEQQRALYARVPALRDWRAVALPANLDHLDVPPRSLYLEYLVGDDELLVAWLAGSTDAPVAGAALLPQPARALAETATNALDPAALKDARAWAARSRPLSDALLAPVREILSSADACVVVPDDLLWRVPFEALAIDGHDLASHMAVSYAASLTSLANRHAGAAGSPAHDFVLISPALPPAFADTEPTARHAIASAAATVIAAPTEMNGAAPLFSSVLLAGGSGTTDDDGRLELREWFGMQAGGTVVLTDGRSFGRKGIAAAMDALDWATAAAGARALFVARPPGDGYAQGALLRDLITRLVRGEPATAAWRAAIADARATAGAAPASWAGLRLLGDPR